MTLAFISPDTGFDPLGVIFRLIFETLGSIEIICRRDIEGKGKGHPCTGTKALYRPYGP
jgi:hypothetical protein